MCQVDEHRAPAISHTARHEHFHNDALDLQPEINASFCLLQKRSRVTQRLHVHLQLIGPEGKFSVTGITSDNRDLNDGEDAGNGRNKLDQDATEILQLSLG
ncbi:uncharacterized [Tachysurus ichikawai]